MWHFNYFQDLFLLNLLRTSYNHTDSTDIIYSNDISQELLTVCGTDFMLMLPPFC
jgi:hypothetical protein